MAAGQPEIRALEVPPASLQQGDVADFVRLFGQLESAGGGHSPRQLRGQVIVLYPSVDDDPRPNYLIPAVRRHIRALYQQLPHFMYYLVPQQEMGAVAMHVMCLLPEERLVQHGEQAAPNLGPDEFAEFLAARLRPAVDFCRAQGDAPAEMLQSLSANCPPQIWSLVLSRLGEQS